jgi:hypothetical protein
MTEEILLNVTPARVMVDPGGTAQVVLQVQNRTGVVDDFVVDVLGDAANWTTLDCAQVAVFPDGVGSVQVSIQPPRANGPAAGTIPVGFRVRSTVNPALSTVEECRVDVKPFVEIAGEIAPKTARGRFSATHNLRVINKGNAPATVSVRAEVQQGDVQVQVPAGQLVVPSGQRLTTKVKVRPGSSRWQGADEMHSYRLSLEPQGGAPVPIDAMMRQRPILGIPIAMLLAIALLLLGAYAVYGKGGNGNPLQTALRWTGAVDVLQTPTAASTQQAAPSPSGQAVVTQPSSAPSQAATPSSSPTSAPTTGPSAAPTFRPITIHPTILPILFCTPLSTVTMTDSINGTSHTLSWTSNATCGGTYTGTITETYRPKFCLIGFPCNGGTATANVSGATGTSPPFSIGSAELVSYVIVLSDGNGHTATSAAVP